MPRTHATRRRHQRRAAWSFPVECSSAACRCTSFVCLRKRCCAAHGPDCVAALPVGAQQLVVVDASYSPSRGPLKSPRQEGGWHPVGALEMECEGTDERMELQQRVGHEWHDGGGEAQLSSPPRRTPSGAWRRQSPHRCWVLTRRHPLYCGMAQPPLDGSHRRPPGGAHPSPVRQHR